MPRSRMQFTASDVFDGRKEPESVPAEYGATPYANGCLLARRLVENGVRYVQDHFGPGQVWDDHKEINKICASGVRIWTALPRR